jgi:very-long-chain enoyl-CoA reductase
LASRLPLRPELLLVLVDLKWRVLDQRQQADYAYAGALLITLARALFRQQIYGDQEMSVAQLVAVVCVSLHYGRRLFESHFLHRYTAELPKPIIAWGCLFYYNVLFGCIVMKQVMTPGRQMWFELSDQTAVFLGFFYMEFEWLNFRCHLITRSLRRPGTTERGIPKGYGFDYVIMANYLWEGLAWTVFIPLVQTSGSVFFSLASWSAMYYRGVEKYAKYMEHAP